MTVQLSDVAIAVVGISVAVAWVKYQQRRLQAPPGPEAGADESARDIQLYRARQEERARQAKLH